MAPANYDNELLDMANDLAARLLPAFDETATGIPYPRVSVKLWVSYLDKIPGARCINILGQALP